MSPSSIDRAGERHRQEWGDPEIVARAPGRVNLIGEHTDYNDGFALPMALPFDTAIALSSAGDPVDGPVVVDSAGFGRAEIDASRPLDSIAEGVPSWARHLVGVVALLRQEGVSAGGWRATIETDIPTGASLSSSAALEVATIVALLARDRTHWTPIEIARLGQRVENEVVGLPSGIMDQFISAGAVAGHASLMDCRALTLEPSPLPPLSTVAIMDTGTRRVLAEGAYADRRAACERASIDLGVRALRDASLDHLDEVSDPVDRRRARHVISENDRTLAAAAAMRAGDAVVLGRLMSESHRSLRDDYEVSGPALDAIVTAASTAPGCYGARMTGGGFAGCAVALVDRDAQDEFERTVLDRYDPTAFGADTARIWFCTPAPGASIVDGAS